ncbi:MAG: xanthine dehydrogenase family protein subunit M [Gemmatimonadaceae bacterium]|nr:xanthine dehydrogenase family protein subunit M [Gemmatimonadaceae bacterium]
MHQRYAIQLSDSVRPFTYHRASSLDDATRHLADKSAIPIGGGTDLLVFLQEELAEPSELVGLSEIPGWRDIDTRDDGSIRLGAGARISDIARHADIQRSFPALSQACDSVGTTALRHMGTLGGNLCQRPRCWYFRRNIKCLKNGGSDCPAKLGENQYHAIFGGGPCYIVHPSDPAVALTALDAQVEIAGKLGTRTVAAEDFFVLPSVRLDRETVLEHGEVVVAVEIPVVSAGGRQRYDKLMQRGSWDFALVSVAAVKRRDGDVRLVLGGVAPKPWRVTSSIEEDVASGNLDETDTATLAERALYDARPLDRNGYKVEQASALLRRAITFLNES